MTKLTRLIDQLTEAQADYEARREDKMLQISSYGHQGRMAQAQTSARIAAAEVLRCKDNLCAFILDNRDKLRIEE